MKDDTISRAAALDALGERPVVWSDNDDYTLGERNQYDMDRLAIETVPSSQPDVPDTNVGDMISRQGVLRLLNAVPSEEFATKAMLISGVNALPSAQPDVLDTNVGDMISRQAALDIYDDYNVAVENGELEAYSKHRKRLLELPPAQPGWIPCTTETMPKMTDTYLVQVGINENGEGMHTEVRTADWNVVWHEWYVHTTRCFVGDIIKWMPIPWEGGQYNG